MGVAPRLLSEGFGLVECPRWHDGALYFADWNAGEIRRLCGAGASEVVARVASLPLSFDVLPDGTMVVVCSPERRLLRLGADGALAPYADLSVLPASGWNEIVADAGGGLFVNGGNTDPPGGERAAGMVARVGPGGDVRQVADDLAFPNGMAITPDGRTLVVAESWRGRLTAFDIGSDGALLQRRVWAEVNAPDGICLDAAGACWVAQVPDGRCVRIAEGGAVLDEVTLDRGAFACMLGGETLYITAASWFGMDRIADMVGTGQVLAAPAPAPHAGRP